MELCPIRKWSVHIHAQGWKAEKQKINAIHVMQHVLTSTVKFNVASPKHD
jgi:hypothetical protein